MRIFLVFTIFIFSFCNQQIKQEEIEKTTLEKPKIIIPERELPVSLTKFVDWTAVNGDLKKLREVSISENDFEVRIWFSGRLETKGLIVKKERQKWSALIVDLSPLTGDRFKRKMPINPKSSWAKVWGKFTEAELLTLSDSSEVEGYDGDRITDGFGYIVEINKDKIYRVYEYRNPNWVDIYEAKQMVKIAKIVQEEFGLEIYFDKDSGKKITKE